MGRLPDETSLAHISIPGTHDSGVRFGGLACECPEWTIAQQLDACIRDLDIRARRAKGSLAIYHGQCFQKMTLGDVLDQTRAFLDEHPGETILMRVLEVLARCGLRAASRRSISQPKLSSSGINVPAPAQTNASLRAAA